MTRCKSLPRARPTGGFWGAAPHPITPASDRYSAQIPISPFQVYQPSQFNSQPGWEVRSPAIAFPGSRQEQTATRHQSTNFTALNAREKKKIKKTNQKKKTPTSREGTGRRESLGRCMDAAGCTDACGPPQPPTPTAVPAGCGTVTQGSRRLHKPQRCAQPQEERKSKEGPRS